VILENGLAAVFEKLAIGDIDGEQSCGCKCRTTVGVFFDKLVEDIAGYNFGITKFAAGDAEAGDEVAAGGIASGESGFRFSDGGIEVLEFGFGFPESEQGGDEAIAHDPEIRGLRVGGDGFARKIGGFGILGGDFAV
jgi:hypothetical protein